jgi:competence protein ComEC
MFPILKKYWLSLTALILLVGVVYIFYLDFKGHKHELTFAMLDIGQGDSLFIESPTGTQILFDAGPPKNILGQLARMMPSFDRSIDAIVITNPDQDHIGGFLDVLKNYKVGKVFEPGTFNDSTTYKNLEAEIEKQKIPDVLAKRGMRLNIGGGAYIDILFPDRDVSLWDSNDGSVVAKLSYGNESIMLTGDSTAKTERILLDENSPAGLQSTILKAGHHGSRTSSSLDFVKAVAPSYFLISDGKDNKYGHPHQETLDIVSSVGAQIFRTDLLGTIIMHSDGQNMEFSFLK